jgi:endonuclease YncB( thermonuclease family)
MEGNMVLTRARMLTRLLLASLIALVSVPSLASTATTSTSKAYPGQAQGNQAVSHTFPQTGKTVSGKFLEYWLIHGGLPQQGFPISNELSEVSDTDGKAYTVQYFERAVFEYHPENPAPNDVLLSLLGTFLYKQKYPGSALAQEPNNTPGLVLFPETGKVVGGKFLTYWSNNGGLAQQGYPISEEFSEKSDLDGKTYRVQYFERAVFELHPENPAPNDVLLSQLGTFRYRAKYEGANAQQPLPTTTPVPSAGWETALVTKVVDGDTITVTLNGQSKTVRYLLVNTPETVDPHTPAECFGKEASNANGALVEGKTVYLAKDISEADQVGRLLRYVFTQEGFVNAELVKAGYAQVATYPPDVKYEQYLRDLERQAREAKRGLWGPPCNGVTTPPVQATPKPNPTSVPTPRPPTPAPPTGSAKVVIASIYYDGQESRTEGDEYITFPSFVLNPGASVRVYTNRDIAGSFSFNRGSAIWDNDGDCGYLYNPKGTQVSEYCY